MAALALIYLLCTAGFLTVAVATPDHTVRGIPAFVLIAAWNVSGVALAITRLL